MEVENVLVIGLALDERMVILLGEVKMKKCSKCGEEKELNTDNFYFNKGYWRPDCKECRKQYLAIYYQNNAEDIKAGVKENYQNNKEEIKEYKAEYRANNKEKISEYGAKYYQDNKEKIKEKTVQYNAKSEVKEKRNMKARQRRQTDPNFKLRDSVRLSIIDAIKRNGSIKNGQSINKYLLYAIAELKAHLENLFEPWMNWTNHGRYNPKTWNDLDQSTWTWQIDHIIPHSTFHYTSMEDQAFKDCWALSNLQPLSAKQNVIDGARRTRH